MKLDSSKPVAFRRHHHSFGGYGLKKLIPRSRANIPAPVRRRPSRRRPLLTFAYPRNWQPLAFDTTLPGAADDRVLHVGGIWCEHQAAASRRTAVVACSRSSPASWPPRSNIVGGSPRSQLGQHPLMGVLAGSVTLTGGPATGLAFAPLFEKAGVAGASTLAVAAAMVGIVAGGLTGGPIGTFLVGVTRGVRSPRRRRARWPTSPSRNSPSPRREGACG